MNAQVWSRIEGPQSPDRGGLDSLTLQEVIEKHHVPGVSVAVIKDFALDWATGLGSADVISASPVHARTLFQAASISKPVTAIAVLKLAQEDKLSLDADVNGMLKSWKLQQGQFGGMGCCRFQRHLVKVWNETGGGSWEREGNSAESSSLRLSSW